jgi:hypothetical protein
MADPMQWRTGDIVLATNQGIVLERRSSESVTGLPRWYQLSPAGLDIVGYDPDDAVLLARWVDGKRLPVIDLEGMAGKAPCYHPGGATWAGNCIDCGKPCAPDLRDEPDGAA